MKKILQAMDSVKESVPVENTNDMKKFMSIITEGSNPHKVALPVQMAMQHYAEPIEKKPSKPSLFKKYMAEASAEQEEQVFAQKAELKSYAQMIASKVMEDAIPGYSAVPTESTENPTDIVKMDIPLLIRLLEYAREDAQTDMDLHDVTERLIKLSSTGKVLSMHQYDRIVGAPRQGKDNGF